MPKLLSASALLFIIRFASSRAHVTNRQLKSRRNQAIEDDVALVNARRQLNDEASGFVIVWGAEEQSFVFLVHMDPKLATEGIY